MAALAKSTVRFVPAGQRGINSMVVGGEEVFFQMAQFMHRVVIFWVVLVGNGIWWKVRSTD